MDNLARARQLKKEAGSLFNTLATMSMANEIKAGELNGRISRLADQAHRRYRRRSEAEADIRWPNRTKVAR